MKLRRKGDVLLQKADPYGNRTQPAPLWNSVVADVSDFTWNDSGWMAERKKYDDRRRPVSIYETSLGQWKSGKELVAFAKEKGYTHVNFIRLWNFWRMAQTDTLHLHTLQSAHVIWHTSRICSAGR